MKRLFKIFINWLDGDFIQYTNYNPDWHNGFVSVYKNNEMTEHYTPDTFSNPYDLIDELIIKHGIERVIVDESPTQR